MKDYKALSTHGSFWRTLLKNQINQDDVSYVDNALKDMTIVMKQQNRAEEVIEAIKSLQRRYSDQAQESLDNILLDLYKDNYIEAEDAYMRALVIAPDNNKKCNLGICMMKQGRPGEAKGTLRLVKPAVMDGPRTICEIF
uniref:Uncharacterized protein n=1 Tax=Lactuca sativa TaxID=4236 RepID=A0A9R1UMS3_LACSA|nr:hypothetical protein LSAT_V11C800433280 [Lactuca sativa]